MAVVKDRPNPLAKVGAFLKGAAEVSDTLKGEQHLASADPALYRAYSAMTRMGQAPDPSAYYKGIRRAGGKDWTGPSGLDRVGALLADVASYPAAALGALAGGALGGATGPLAPVAAPALGLAGRAVGFEGLRHLARIANPEEAGRSYAHDIVGAAAGYAGGTALSGAYQGAIRPALAKAGKTGTIQVADKVQKFVPSVAGSNAQLPKWLPAGMQTRLRGAFGPGQVTPPTVAAGTSASAAPVRPAPTQGVASKLPDELTKTELKTVLDELPPTPEVLPTIDQGELTAGLGGLRVRPPQMRPVASVDLDATAQGVIPFGPARRGVGAPPAGQSVTQPRPVSAPTAAGQEQLSPITYHGTKALYTYPSWRKMQASLYGPGHYTTESSDVAASYAGLADLAEAGRAVLWGLKPDRQIKLWRKWRSKNPEIEIADANVAEDISMGMPGTQSHPAAKAYNAWVASQNNLDLSGFVKEQRIKYNKVLDLDTPLTQESYAEHARPIMQKLPKGLQKLFHDAAKDVMERSDLTDDHRNFRSLYEAAVDRLGDKLRGVYQQNPNRFLKWRWEGSYEASKALLNRALRAAGYDALHYNGQLDKKVWIALAPSKVVPPGGKR